MDSLTRVSRDTADISRNSEEHRTHLAHNIGRLAAIVLPITTLLYIGLAVATGQVGFWFNVLCILPTILLAVIISLRSKVGIVLCRLLLFSSLLTLLGIGCILGADVPLMAFYPALVLAALILLDVPTTVFLCATALLGFALTYTVQEILRIYTPVIRFDTITRQIITLFLWIAGTSSSAIVAIFMYYDNRRSLRMVKQQADQLAAAKEELMAQYTMKQSVGQRVVVLVGDLTDAAQRNTLGARNQIAALTQMSASLTELAQAANHIAERAQSVEQAVSQSRRSADTLQHITVEAAEVGQRSVEAFAEIANGNKRIEQTYQQLTRTLVGLAENSRQIRGILSLIKGITDETHMLALNAAIEAAGAGQNGARFGVIAAQIKALADRSLSATGDVQTIITGIENAISAAVMVAESGAAEVGRTAMIARVSSGTMNDLATTIAQAEADAADIAQAISDVRNLAREIAAATSQQQRADVQVLEALQEVQDLARQSAESSHTVQRAAGNLEAVTADITKTLTI